MTPTQEKAKELFNKYFALKWQSYSNNKTSIKSMTKSSAKQCALISVDEVLTLLDKKWTELDFWTEEMSSLIIFYLEVKKEIEKL